MHETFEGSEAYDLYARAAGLDPYRAADEIKQYQQREHAEDGDAADSEQPHFMQLPPHASHRLPDHLLFGVRDGAEALDTVELLQQLFLLDRVRSWIDRIGLLGRGR